MFAGIAGSIAVLAAVVMEGPNRASGLEPNDFVQYYVSAWRLKHDFPIYDPIVVDGALAKSLGWHHHDPNRTPNPPILICLSWPLAQMPYPVAWWSLAIGSLVTLGLGSWLAALRSGWGRAGACAWALIATGSASTLAFVVLNHIEAPILLLGVAGWLCLRDGRRPFLGASLWGLSAALKLFPAFWLVALLRLRDRRIALIGFTSAAAFSALGVAIIGWDDTLVFLRSAIPQSKGWESDLANMSVRSFCIGLFGNAFGIALMGATVIGLLWAIFLGNRSIDRLWCLGLCGSLLLSPLSWSYYVVLAVPVAALVSARLDLSGPTARARFAVWFCTLFFWPSLLGRWMPGIETIESWGWPSVILAHAPTLALATLAWLGHRHLGEPPAAVDPVTPAAAAGS